MTTTQDIANGFQKLANELKATRVLVNGNAIDLSALTTTDKTNLVAALNEIKAAVDSAAATGGASINDTTPGTSTTYSSSKIDSQIAAATPAASETVAGLVELATTAEATTGTDALRATTPAGVKAVVDAMRLSILGTVDSAHDTLQELQAIMESMDSADEGQIQALVSAVAVRLRFDDVQTLTAAQKIQGNANLGSVSLADFGSTTTDYVALINAALV